MWPSIPPSEIKAAASSKRAKQIHLIRVSILEKKGSFFSSRCPGARGAEISTGHYGSDKKVSTLSKRCHLCQKSLRFCQKMCQLCLLVLSGV